MNTVVADALDSFLSQDPIPLHYGGEWHEASDGNTIEILRPSTGARLTAIAGATAEDVDRAVDAAADAFPAWAAMDVADRCVLLHRLADAIDRERETLATLESRDIGKLYSHIYANDVPFAANAYRYFADLAMHTRMRQALPLARLEAEEVRLPRGACGFITPWNAPFMVLGWGFAPALAAGNTVVSKPPELAPLSALYLCKLAQEVGFPDGVMNVVPGIGEVAGAALANHPRLDMISFTGSPEIGKTIAEAAARNLTPSKLELGGKGAAVVFPDVDVAATAKALATAVTRNAGQVCCTATRWMIHEDIVDDFIGEATSALQAMRIGAESDSEADYGAVISERQRRRILGYVERGGDQGAELLLEGGAHAVPGHEGGFYVKPALLTGASTNVCAREEIFGPVAYLMPFGDENGAVELVNDVSYGLANSVWSEDLQRARRVAERLVAGTTWINAHNVFAYGLPYGGVNLSGWGGGVNSPQTLFDYQRELSIARPL